MKRKKAVKYRRVSTKEQALKGFSLETQGEILDRYAKENDLEIVGDYVDDGFSASSSKRPSLKRLLNDIELGGIDLIIFTKLDRWFRSVSQYYKIQDKLDEYKVPWRTVLEDYNTETSDGKFKVNIMLSVAQNEIDKTSERIKEIFDSKIAKKQAVTGAQPFGYKIENSRIIKDPETAHIVEDMFKTFEREQSYKETLRQLKERHGFEFQYTTMVRLIGNRKYTGFFRDIPDYYPPYISTSKFEELQLITEKNIKWNTDKVFIFSGLLKCAECGHSLAGNGHFAKRYNKVYMYYRCNYSAVDEECSKTHRLSETKFEENLLKVIVPKINDHIIEIHKTEEESDDCGINVEELQEELERLNNMYRKGRISEEVYDYDYEQISKQLEMVTKPKVVNRNLERVISSGFLEFYEDLSPSDKRLIWRSIIDKIEVHSATDFEIHFL